MRKILLLALGLAAVLIGLSLKTPAAKGLTISSGRDCDANAVIRCGALNFDELQNRSQQTGVSQIFSAFGIDSQDMADIRSTAVEGQVTKSGNVMVNGQVVAINAITAGRQNMPGSTPMTSGGVNFFERPTSVSLVSSPLPAFVVMVDGRFSFAILASCGNPVMATPLMRPVVKKPTSVTPGQTTPVPSAQPQSQTQTQSQSQTINLTNTPAVQSTTTTAPVPTPAPVTKSLPNTGPGGLLAVSGAATIFGSLGHYLYTRRRFS